MRTSVAGWVFVGSLPGCVLATSACELIVGGGDYKTAGGDGGGGAESGGVAGSGVGSSGGVAGSGVGSSGGVAGSGVGSSGVGGSGAGGSGASSGASGSSGAGGSGASSGASGSSGAGGSGASSGVGGSGASSGTGSSEASAFVGTWQTSSTQVFSNCTDASYDGSGPTTGAFTWTISGTGLTGAQNARTAARSTLRCRARSPGPSWIEVHTDECHQRRNRSVYLSVLRLDTQRRRNYGANRRVRHRHRNVLGRHKLYVRRKPERYRHALNGSAELRAVRSGGFS